MNYDGLNEFMIAESSPSAETPPTPFYQFDSQVEAIGATRISNGVIKNRVLVYQGKLPRVLIGRF